MVARSPQNTLPVAINTELTARSWGFKITPMSGRIVEYKILTSADIGWSYKTETLDKLVNQAIAEGWEPIGGVGINATDTSAPYFYQAIVKRAGQF